MTHPLAASREVPSNAPVVTIWDETDESNFLGVLHNGIVYHTRGNIEPDEIGTQFRIFFDAQDVTETIHFLYKMRTIESALVPSAEQKYLVCEICGEAFDSMETASAHEEQHDENDDIGFVILPESEAL